ncbi:MAG: hypothetical protein MUF58_22710 [Arcicella sp.]|jgi:hypothetical protein|nr:hypothetical protein [Arcicella sp.]
MNNFPMEKQQIFYRIERLSTFEKLLNEEVLETQKLNQLLEETEDKPYLMDDATMNRSLKFYQNGIDYMPYYRLQFNRWKSQELTPEQTKKINDLEFLVDLQLRFLEYGMALSKKIAKNTIENILSKSDFEIGFEALFGKGFN